MAQFRMLGVAIALAVAIGVAHTGLASPAIAPRRVVNRIAAIVDTTVITQLDVDRRFGPKELHVAPDEQAAKRHVVVLALVEEALIAAEAERRHISVEADEIDRALELIAQQNNMTVADVLRVAAEQGFDATFYRDELRRQIVALRTIQQWAVDDPGRPDPDAARLKMLAELRKRAYVEVRL